MRLAIGPQSLWRVVARIEKVLGLRLDPRDLIFQTLEQVAAAFPDARQDRLDGITIEYDEWWCNVRKSNTEPVLRLNLEANDEPMLATARARVIEAIGAEPEA